MCVGHFDLGWHIWRTMKAPLDGLLEGELPNTALGHSALPWKGAVNERYAFYRPHIGVGACA